MTRSRSAATMRPVLILASASPRRQQLLGWLGVEYVIEPARVDEEARPGESAAALVGRLGRSKAEAVGRRRPGDWVIAADTIVEIDDALLGKPVDAAEARAMLARLAGREHRVFTGFALIGPGGTLAAEQVVTTRVRFRPLSPTAIASYVASGEPEGKAGGYAIQGHGAGLIASIEGSFTNVIGLPLVEVGRALGEAGLVGGA